MRKMVAMNSRSIASLVFTIFIALLSCALSAPDGFLNINCGATDNATDSNGLEWITDSQFIKSPNVNASTLASLNSPYLQYRSLTYFRNLAAKKYCYLLPVKAGLRYLVRATFGYEGSDCRIPLARFFDLVIEGIKWTKVDLSKLEEVFYVDYEIILAAKSDSLSLCLARDGEPEEKHFVYISSIALRPLNSSMYNSTDFEKQALNLIGRTDFGQYRYYGKPDGYLGYPDDQYDRLWKPYSPSSMTTGSIYLEAVADEYGTENLGSELWNKPPMNVLRTAIAKQGVGDMSIMWAFNLSCSSGSYYFALYFCSSIQTNLSQIFNVFINNYQVSDYQQYGYLQCRQVNRMLELPTSDPVNITLSGGSTSKMGPFINAAELYKILDVARTYSGDALAIRKIAEAINVPDDWAVGDPCFPAGHSVTGITCSTDNPARVIVINLRNKGLKGTLPPEIANLTALTQLLLGNNNLSGPVPDLSSLKNLTKLQLQNNQLTGEIPRSLENLPNLTHLFLQNNKLKTTVSQRLWGRRMNLQNKANSPSPPSSKRGIPAWGKMLLIGLSALVGGVAVSATLLSQLRRLCQRCCCTSQDNVVGNRGRAQTAGKQTQVGKQAQGGTLAQVGKLAQGGSTVAAQVGRRASIFTRLSRLVRASCLEDSSILEDVQALGARPEARPSTDPQTEADADTETKSNRPRDRNRNTEEDTENIYSETETTENRRTARKRYPEEETGNIFNETDQTENIRPRKKYSEEGTENITNETDQTENIRARKRYAEEETENRPPARSYRDAETPASTHRDSQLAAHRQRQVTRSEIPMPPPTNDAAFQAIFLSRYVELQNRLLDATLQIGRLQEREAIMSQSSRAIVPTTYVSRVTQAADRPENPEK